ncbi:uncharacterized protein C8A04DRAFT_12487 [Dichotomopilus funicola]|uniref:Uncharacterized protein n=1 Tax=Dichotomopilus funicola TaxID=1934379 RepID=A0AAN6ZMH6_9PEZI|nr:hypothetical protein C8A04DRAFT_12487 [Dichotomopilus funicola]
MSTLGKNLVKAPTINADDACNKAGDAVDGAVDQVGDTANDIGNTIGGIFSRKPSVGDAIGDACKTGADAANQAVQISTDAINKALGSIAKAIGIQEYYSVHIGALCEGNYKPSFDDKDAKPDVSKCTPKFKTEQTDLSKKLDDELQVGPFKFKLSDLDLVDDIKDGFAKIPGALAAMAFFFLFATIALVLGFLFSLAVAGLDYAGKDTLKKFALFGAIGCLGVGWFTTLIGAAVTTGIAETIKKAVNKFGDKFGMSAHTSPGLYFLLWSAMVCSFLALAMLAFLWFKTRGGRGMGHGPSAGAGQQQAQYNTNKNMSESSMEDSHGFAQMQTSGGRGRFTEEPL